MTEAHGAEAPFHHFASIEQQHDAARLGMWFFLATETLLFGGIFTSYTVYHNLHPQVFARASLRLAWVLEAVNTVVLLSSGFTMAVVEYHATRLARPRVMQFLTLTIALGVTFLVLKGFEYHADYLAGTVPFLDGGWHYAGLAPEQAKLFYNFYFLLTGLHATHMVIAITLLSLLLVRAWLWRSPFAVRRMIGAVGLFWAFIDVVWLFIYSSLYLIGRAGAS